MARRGSRKPSERLGGIPELTSQIQMPEVEDGSFGILQFEYELYQPWLVQRYPPDVARRLKMLQSPGEHVETAEWQKEDGSVRVEPTVPRERTLQRQRRWPMWLKATPLVSLTFPAAGGDPQPPSSVQKTALAGSQGHTELQECRRAVLG